MSVTIQDEPPFGSINDEGEIYSPVMDDSSFDVREQNGRRAMFLLAGGFGALLLLALIILKAYSPGTRGDGEPPRILADTSPYKSAPENPGGVETPNQDKTVYDVISGENRDDAVRVVQDSETPIEINPEPIGATVTIKGSDTVAAPIAVIESPVSVAPVTVAPAPVVSDVYVIQVASFRSQEQANVGWSNLNGKFGSLIASNKYADIKRKDLGERGVHYRLRVAGFPDKASATQLCDDLKARQQDCLVVKR